jgi:hypothetical protein
MRADIALSAIAVACGRGRFFLLLLRFSFRHWKSSILRHLRVEQVRITASTPKAGHPVGFYRKTQNSVERSWRAVERFCRVVDD